MSASHVKAEPLRGSKALAVAHRILHSQGIIAVKGLGGYHLVCDARSVSAIARLRRSKQRPDKPLAIMFRHLEALQKECHTPDLAIELLTSALKPIIILQRRESSTLPRLLAPGLDTIGALLPYTPLHLLLFDHGLDVLVATSANHSGEPITFQDDEALERMGPMVDGILTHDQEILMPLDDSVLYCVDTLPDPNSVVIRRSRGYAPYPLTLARPVSQVVLGCGSDLKASFCLGNGKLAFPSPYLGNLESPETMERYRYMFRRYKELLDLEPTAVGYDLNPAFVSSQIIAATDFAELPQIPIQHHHAHIAACMGENGVSQPVIGIAYDGAGYGLDGKVWGGEILYCTPEDFRRLAHWQNVSLPGNDLAIHQPWRMALSYLIAATEGNPCEDSLGNVLGLFLERLPPAIRENAYRLLNIWDKVQTAWLQTSSMGRLFDGVAALLGLCFEASYTGQPAILLENAAWRNVRKLGLDTVKPYEISEEPHGLEHLPQSIQLTPLIHYIVADLARGTDVSEIAARFHRTIAQITAINTIAICQELNTLVVAMSGGVWQNQLLHYWTKMLLDQVGLDVISHKQLSPGDECIGFGQVIITGAKLGQGGNN